ncbi:MAG: Recombination protein RecR [candidate division TM6 bacterium GW2011_GWF2_32_72]|nr:MAG: Recombination protein RecR [candidate division TM6 bacterium GW2011_GWF2_32_72]
MLKDVPSLEQLLKLFQQVPYLASKNIFRVADYFLKNNGEKIDSFCQSLLEVKRRVAQCNECFCWKEKDKGCPICSSARRNKRLICVVETWQDLLAIEKTAGYLGVYHVLGGAISPLDGIGPEDLTINYLELRCKQGIDEIILATNQTPEGEATASYVASFLKNSNIKISCLAKGVPVGSSLEYMDKLTVYKAISERRPF